MAVYHETYSFLHPQRKKFQECKEFTWSEREEKINDKFVRLRLDEMKEHQPYFFEKDTTKYLNQIRKTKIYAILDVMPKGVVHHMHGDCNEDLEYLLKYIVDSPGVYISNDMKFWQYGSQQEAKDNNWITPAEARKRFTTDEQYHEAILSMTQFRGDAVVKHSYTLDVWNHFEDKISSFLNILLVEDHFRNYYRHMLRKLIKEGYIRVQIRAGLFPLRKNHTTKDMVNEEGIIRIFEQVEKEIQAEYPFFSLGLIIQGLKVFTQEELYNYFKNAYEIQSPLIIAIDLVQEEEKYQGFQKYQPVLQKLHDEYEGKRKLPGAYHAGETKYVLNHNVSKVSHYGTLRIGHGLNLFQHSYLVPEVRDKKICIEVCPLSNQFLNFVYNLTQHPAIAFYHMHIPISINSDDPARFGYNGVTPDFYVAAHAFAFELKDMKLIGIYSIIHSICTEEKKKEMLELFSKQWEEFMHLYEEKFL